MNYRIQTGFVGEPLQIVVEKKCNAIVFTNRGTNPARINGETINQNESISNCGLQNEFDQTPHYDITFDTSGGGTSLLYWRQKVYE